MRRKVEDLAAWLAAGDRKLLREARRSIVELLCTAAGMTGAEDGLKLRKSKPRKRRR